MNNHFLSVICEQVLLYSTLILTSIAEINEGLKSVSLIIVIGYSVFRLLNEIHKFNNRNKENGKSDTP